ncbi:hypothetical protein Tco_1420055 [Tanacetum coccineum]
MSKNTSRMDSNRSIVWIKVTVLKGFILDSDFKEKQSKQELQDTCKKLSDRQLQNSTVQGSREGSQSSFYKGKDPGSPYTANQVPNDTPLGTASKRANDEKNEYREQYHEIQDLKAQMQDKNIAISELKKLIENCKGKSVETQFDKPSVVRQPNALRIPKPSVLGKPTPFSNSSEMRSFQHETVGFPTGKFMSTLARARLTNEPTHVSIVDIPYIHASKQTLGLSAGISFNGQKQQRIDLNADALYNEKQENLRVWLLKLLISKKPVPECSGLVLHQMTSDHNLYQELGIQEPQQ